MQIREMLHYSQMQSTRRHKHSSALAEFCIHCNCRVGGFNFFPAGVLPVSCFESPCWVTAGKGNFTALRLELLSVPA